MTNEFKDARQQRRELMSKAKSEMGFRMDKVMAISLCICAAVVLAGIAGAVLIITGTGFDRTLTMDNPTYGTVQGTIRFGVNLKNQISSGKVTLTFETPEAASGEFSRLEKLTNDFYEEQSAEGEYPNYYEDINLDGNRITFRLTEAYLDVFVDDRVYSDREVEALCDRIQNVVFIYHRTGAVWTYVNDGSSTVTGLIDCTMTYDLNPDMTVKGIQVKYSFEGREGVNQMKQIVEDESDQYYTNHVSYAVMLGLVNSSDEPFKEYSNMVTTETTLSYDYSDIYISLYNMTGGCMEDALRGFELAGGQWNWTD